MSLVERMAVYFCLVEDKRNKSYVEYRLPDILLLLICGIICGCENAEAIIEFGEEREEFFRQHTEFERMPCPKTLLNVLHVINPSHLELCLYGILRNVFSRECRPKERQICIDGKTVCSTAVMKEYEKPLHIITGLLADYRVTVGQITVNDKSNEIPAVRELLDLIDIKGAVVTLDAMHCQKDTVEKIIENKADYVVQLKRNQGNFYEDVYAMFDEKYMDETDTDCEYEMFETIEKGHGRIEKRVCYVLRDVEYFTDYLDTWKGLKKIFAVKRTVTKDEKTSVELSCYLSSANAPAEKLLSYTRKHWQIESFHWLLDVNFGEDSSKVRNKNAQICLNVMRKFSISMLKKYIDNNPVKRKTISANMRKCLLNPSYLESILQYFCS